MSANDVRWLPLNGALAVARGGLREVVKRLAKDGSLMSDVGVLHEVATIRYLADTLERSVSAPPKAASVVPNAAAPTPEER